MMRSELEARMKQLGLKHIVIVVDEHDPLGMFCELKGGFLVDYTGHRIDRKKNIWGYLTWPNQIPARHPLSEL